MNLEFPTVLVVSTIVIICCPLLMRMILEKAQPGRIELARLGKQLLSSDRLTTEQKRLVTELLSDAFDWRVMVWAVILFPVVAVRVALRKRGRQTIELDALRHDREFGRFLDLHTASTLAANPLFGFVFCIEMMLATFVFMVFTSVRMALQQLMLETTVKSSKLANESRWVRIA